MPDALKVAPADRTGEPSVRVPHRAMWEFDAYLSQQRIRVGYTYGSADVTVCFRYSDHQTAQKLLDGWVARRDAGPFANPG